MNKTIKNVYSDLRIGAFSLIELLIVITITALVSGYSITSYRTYTNKTKVSQMIESLSTCQLAISASYYEKFTFPNTIDCFGGIAKNVITAIPGYAGFFYFTTGTTAYSTPKLQMYIYRNDLLAPTGINPARLYVGMYIKDNVIYSNCGNWANDPTSDVDPDLLPDSCRDQVSSTTWVQ
jgi:prepilin-type N-terminal cleavage/methylation domain-containing protein